MSSRSLYRALHPTHTYTPCRAILPVHCHLAVRLGPSVRVGRPCPPPTHTPPHPPRAPRLRTTPVYVGDVQLPTPPAIVSKDAIPEGAWLHVVVTVTGSTATMYGTFRADFHHFGRFELDLRRNIHVRGAAFSCLRLKLADMVLI